MSIFLPIVERDEVTDYDLLHEVVNLLLKGGLYTGLYLQYLRQFRLHYLPGGAHAETYKMCFFVINKVVISRLQLINAPNVTRTLGVTTETVCVWRDGSVMARPARLKKEQDVSRLMF